MKLIQEFQQISSDPHGYAREMKGQGKKCIGYFCSYTPEEIIHAAGIHPMRLFGAKDDTGIADRHLQAYCCSLVRGALADVLSGRLNYLDGAVFPHTCDSIQRLSDIWRLNTAFRFFADIVLPVKLTTESSR
ncbi:MAG: 2-hydroxyacyl-CoA dehydratase family protein, partial [Desulfomonilia bacterium]